MPTRISLKRSRKRVWGVFAAHRWSNVSEVTHLTLGRYYEYVLWLCDKKILSFWGTCHSSWLGDDSSWDLHSHFVIRSPPYGSNVRALSFTYDIVTIPLFFHYDAAFDKFDCATTPLSHCCRSSKYRHPCHAAEPWNSVKQACRVHDVLSWCTFTCILLHPLLCGPLYP